MSVFYYEALALIGTSLFLTGFRASPFFRDHGCPVLLSGLTAMLGAYLLMTAAYGLLTK